MASSGGGGGGGGGQAEEPIPPSQPPLHYQTWVLRVSIHCQACKTKVKKVLHSIEGVYTTSVDSQQQKVIVTGNIDGHTLVKKLAKAGKHAELCAPPEKEKPPPGKGENSDEDEDNDDNTNNNHPPGGTDPHHKVMRISSPGIHGGMMPGTPVRFVGLSDNRPPENAAMDKPPEAKGGGGAQTAGGGGSKKKKKKKKGKNKGAGPGAANTGGAVGPAPKVVGFSEVVDQINPGQTFDQNVCHYPPPPAPPHLQQGYVVSYNAVANPMATGYYAAAPVQVAASTYAEGSGYPMMMRPTPLDSFEILSDENPNGCCIM